MSVAQRRRPRAGAHCLVSSNNDGVARACAARASRHAVFHHLDRAGDDDGGIGRLPGSAPATAALGLASVFLYVLPAFVFLVPVSLVAAELASGWPGGVYNWVREGLSAPMGLLAVWCQFAQTIFYYPALLAYVGSTLAYVIDRRLAGNGVYTAAVIIVLFWGGVLVLVARRFARGEALIERDRDRNADPGRDPRRPRRRSTWRRATIRRRRWTRTTSCRRGADWPASSWSSTASSPTRASRSTPCTSTSSATRAGTIRSRSLSPWRSSWPSSSSRRWRSPG